MSFQALTDDELDTRLCEARSYLEGLAREMDARHWGREGMLLHSARGNCADALDFLRQRTAPAIETILATPPRLTEAQANAYPKGRRT